MPALGTADFGVRTFYAATHPNDKCGPNGLPLTPNSIKILGRFQYLTTLAHPQLCQYLDISKTKHECLIVISEHHRITLREKLKCDGNLGESQIVRLAFQMLDGLTYLHRNNIVHRNLSIDNILIDKQGNIKLSEYGLYYMTDYGADVSFPIGLPRYLAPEVFCSGPVKVDDETGHCVQPISGPKTDVWTFGIILLELILGKELWSGLGLQETLLKMVEFIKTEMSPLDLLCQDQVIADRLKGYSKELRDVLRLCLTVSSTKRAKSDELKQHPLFTVNIKNAVTHKKEYNMFTTELRCVDLELPSYDETIANEFSDDHLSQRSMQEVYYLWRLAGGDLDTVLRKAGMSKTRPPVHLLPCYGIIDGDVFGQDRDYAELLNNTVITLSQEQLRFRLREIPSTAYYPLLEDELKLPEHQLPTSPSNGDLTSSAALPLVIREKDIEYQFHRIILYARLLSAYPFKRPHIWREARVDIPPLVRANVWAALLEVEGDIEGFYRSIDKETATATDRQIEVDIPRCHQYHELLSSPTAHGKFKRVLKAWVLSNPQYVYWQGLDSLCAPFLALSFNNEALAFACLSAFIPKYLNKFFMRDNSAVIQEYLAVFSHLIAFHDPELSNHLDGIGFIPDLYAIPWFLTMYAHVFPLHKIVHLWDTLLLGNSSFPLCIGVSILQQLRDRLLSFGFNECILLFSDMPEIDIERCVQDSIKIFCSTPKSATFRQHARPLKSKSSNDRPNLSYYSRDYHEQPQTDLSMEAMSIEELKGEKCPRISAEDLIELGELLGSASSRSPTKRRFNSKPMIVILDVRHYDDYKRGTLQGSINIPFQTAFSPEGELNPCPAVQQLNSRRNQVVVVVGSRGRNASNFANELVRLGYARVCVLHKGIDVFRTTGLITIPPADI
ncbi:TBC domain-containing protein kinase-like protein [Physella acuta]|uniref:TBC domain-containing protein kinase-like protein n=1 Tax=Physella acuta TaxID=109671 RepID=UPI0027DB2D0E|nr:TBC domain-containing protein kinase-like protein [Physella acuta]XP_059151931.1 TBC domain-containing protein kinase-like protein [Physella acuta]